MIVMTAFKTLFYQLILNMNLVLLHLFRHCHNPDLSVWQSHIKYYIIRQEVVSYDEMCSKRRLDSLAWLQLKCAMIQGFGLMTTMYGKSSSQKIPMQTLTCLSLFFPWEYKVDFRHNFRNRDLFSTCLFDDSGASSCLIITWAYKLPGANDCKQICAATKEESQLFNSSEMQAWISLKDLVLDINASNTFQVEVCVSFPARQLNNIRNIHLIYWNIQIHSHWNTMHRKAVQFAQWRFIWRIRQRGRSTARLSWHGNADQMSWRTNLFSRVLLTC